MCFCSNLALQLPTLVGFLSFSLSKWKYIFISSWYRKSSFQSLALVKTCGKWEQYFPSEPIVPAVVVVTWTGAEGGWKWHWWLPSLSWGCSASWRPSWQVWSLAAPTTLQHTWKFWLRAPHSHKAEMAKEIQHFPSSITSVWVS